MHACTAPGISTYHIIGTYWQVFKEDGIQPTLVWNSCLNFPNLWVSKINKCLVERGKSTESFKITTKDAFTVWTGSYRVMDSVLEHQELFLDFIQRDPKNYNKAYQKVVWQTILLLELSNCVQEIRIQSYHKGPMERLIWISSMFLIQEEEKIFSSPSQMTLYEPKIAFRKPWVYSKLREYEMQLAPFLALCCLSVGIYMCFDSALSPWIPNDSKLLVLWMTWQLLIL